MESLEELDELEEAIVLLSKTIRAKDKGRAYLAFAVFSALFVATFGADSNFCAKVAPLVERLKQDIKNEQFEDAMILSDAFLVRVRHVQELQK